MRRHLRKIEWASGVLLAIFGLLLVTNQFNRLSAHLEFLNPLLEKIEPALPDSSSAAVDSGMLRFDPATSLETLDGRTTTLRELGGTIILLNFFATWCGPCRLETPGFVKLHLKYRDLGAEIVAIAEDSSRKDIRKFMQEFGIAYPVVIDPDGSMADELGVIGLPTSFLIDTDGKVLREWPGYVKEAELEKEFAARLPKSK